MDQVSTCFLRFIAEFLTNHVFPTSNTWRSLEIFNHGLGDTSAAVRSASWLALSRDDSDGPQGAERMDVDTLAGNAASWVQVWFLLELVGYILIMVKFFESLLIIIESFNMM